MDGVNSAVPREDLTVLVAPKHAGGRPKGSLNESTTQISYKLIILH